MDLFALVALATSCLSQDRPAAEADRSAAEGGPAITIYNQDFAVVRQQVELELAAGVTRASFSGITRRLEPDSVILRDPARARAFQVLEQSYRADPVSEGLLLEHFEGQTIPFQKPDGTRVVGRIVRSGYSPGSMQHGYYQPPDPGTQPIIEVMGNLQFGLPGLPLFPALAGDSILEPTLDWVIESERAGPLAAELGYVTGGFTWNADYNMVAPEEGDRVDVIGWVTMRNESGTSFADARIKLLAGDVNKIKQDLGDVRYRLGMAGEAMAPPVQEKSFDDFHLYSLARRTTLRDRETKQVEFVRSAGVLATRIYVYDGAWIDPNRYGGWNDESIRQDKDYGTQSNEKVWVMRELDNTAKNGLGIALPAGRLRFYRQDDDGQLEFVGENEIDHTPRDEQVRVYTGNAFDVVGERVRSDYRVDSRNQWLDETFAIELRNHKEEPVEVRVVEHLYRWSNWELRDVNREWKKVDSRTIEFRVTVAPDGVESIAYTAHYSW